MDSKEHKAVAHSLLDKLHPTLKLLLAAIIPALGSVLVGLGKSEQVEDKADAGFYYTRADVESMKSKIAVLEAKLSQLEADISTVRRAPVRISGGTGKKPPIATLLPVAPTAPKPTPPPAAPLPVSLDDAVDKRENGVAPTPPPLVAPVPTVEPIK